MQKNLILPISFPRKRKGQKNLKNYHKKKLEFALLPTAPQRRITPSSAPYQGKTVDANAKISINANARSSANVVASARASANASANAFKSLLSSSMTTTTSSSAQSVCIPVSPRLELTGRHRFFVRVHTLRHCASRSSVLSVHPCRVHPPIHRA